MNFRRRIIMALLPLLVLLAIVGGTATVLIYRLGTRIDVILRENYDSVIFMRDLNEALERIDSSFQFTLAGRETDAQKQYRDNWKEFDKKLNQEQNNITLPDEAELVDTLSKLSQQYRQQGDAFYEHPSESRTALYFTENDPTGLLNLFRKIKEVSGKILTLNQNNMYDADRRCALAAFVTLVVRRWTGLGCCDCHLFTRPHGQHDSLSDTRAQRVGRSHWSRQSRSTGVGIFRR